MIRTQKTIALPSSLPRMSPTLSRFFAAYNRRYLRRHFHSVRILKKGMPRADYRPLVIFLNHAAWWDPLVCFFLAGEFFADRSSFAPIDAAMLERYRFFRRLGFFPVEQHSRRGALGFLRASHAIMASSRNALWLTPQADFVDPRARPLRFHEGLGILAAPEPNAVFLPLAIEYTYWTEPRPEILISFGDPIAPANETPQPGTEWTKVFSRALEATQDELAEYSCRRRADDWLVLNSGARGINPAWNFWLRLRSLFAGEHYQPDHQTEPHR